MGGILSNLLGFGPAISEKRSSSDQPWKYVTDEEARFLQLMGIEPNKVKINAKSAMSISTFFSAVHLISDLIASQPYSVFQKVDNDIEARREHPLHYLLHNRPNSQMGSYVFRKTMMLNTLVYGYAIAHIIRDGLGRPVALRPYPTRDVMLYQDPDTQACFFRIANQPGVTYEEDDVIFIKDVGFDGIKGTSLLTWQSQVLEIPALIRQHAKKNFEKGAFIAGFLSTPLEATDEETAKIYKRRIVESLSGDEYGGYGLAILGAGAEYKPVQRSLVESEVTKLLDMSDKDIAKSFRVPLVMLGDTEKSTSFGKGIDSLYQILVNNVLLPKVKQFEEEVDYKCFTLKEQREGYYSRMNMRALLRGDALAYAEYVNKMIQNGVYTQNEFRRLDEMAPLPGGDRLWVQQNMMPLDKADEILEGKSNGQTDQEPVRTGETVPVDEE